MLFYYICVVLKGLVVEFALAYISQQKLRHYFIAPLLTCPTKLCWNRESILSLNHDHDRQGYKDDNNNSSL